MSLLIRCRLSGVGSVLIVAIIIGAVMLKRRARRNVFLMQPLYVGGRGPNRLDNNVPRSFVSVSPLSVFRMQPAITNVTSSLFLFP